MVLTRSRSGDSRREQTQQEPSVTAGPGASSSAPESSTVGVTNTGSGSTTTTNTDATRTHGTLKPGDTRSHRSTSSKKKRLAELEARERLAEMKVKQAQAERELQEIQLQRIRTEAESSEDEDLEDDLASVRIGTWLARPAPPPGGETRPPPHDVSNGRNGREAAKDTGAVTGAQPLRDDDDGYGESVCAKIKGNIASEVLHGNVSDKVIDVGTLAAALAQVARSSREPPKYVQQLPIFDGKPGEWIAYKAAYCDSHTYFSYVENVARIRMSLRGAAKEAVGCLLFSQSDPQVILDALERRFGRPEALIMAELDNVKSLPKLNDNPRDICIFASRIANTVGTVEALKRNQYLHSPEMSHCIVEKLTPILKNKFYDYAANKKTEDIPVLKLLSMFMNEEADKCGAYAQPERGYDDSSGVRQRRRVERTFNVNKETSNDQCPACKQHGHKLPDCSKYKQLDIDTRWEIAKNSNMCFRCLRNKHRRFMCKAPICDVKECNMKHHKLLHKERKVEASHNVATPAPTPVITHETVTSARENVSTISPQNRRAYLKIVPVTLSGPHTSVDTYALLDDGSTVTLLDASVADILGADGPASPMWIQGIGTEVKHEQSRTVSLHIQGKHHSDPQKIEAARTVTRLEIMAQTVQTQDINNCMHLDDISSTLVYEDARPMILIGQDNWHLLVATETRTGARDQPVASYTKLGWVLHGCQYSVNKVIATFCGHIKIQENLEPIEETMRNFFKLESLGIEPRIPRDDPQQRALDILEQKSRRLPDGSFETGLLWKQEELTKKNEWRWLPSKDNVADDATRSTPEHFNSEHRWFRGPEFLRKGRDEWPQNKKVIAPMDTGEGRVKCHVINNTKLNDHLPNITRFSKWTRLIRTTARVLQFIDLCRPCKHNVEYKCTKKKASKDPTWKRTHRNKTVKKVTQNMTKNKTINYIPIPATYIQQAEEQWVKGAQAESFSKEIAAIKDNKAAPGDSPISVLSTYLDNAGVLRLRGRITAVQDVNEEIKNPIILEGKHRYTKLYIAYIHESLHHGGTEITVNEIRQRIWITKLRPSVKNVIKGCLYCKIKKAKPAKPSTGNLPYPRLAHHVRPFTFTGLDYFGPISVSVGRHKEKRYGALFTCLTCRAIHIEIASSLSADSAIAALRRFIGRRGCPKEIWSDNATCFKAADRELGESALSALGSESNARSISWKYIPPASPFMGGAWERMVRVVKEALYVTLKEVHPSDETLATLLVEVENTVNSRPLTHVNVSPDEPEALTPNHILIGPNPHVPSPGNFTAADVTARHQWRRAQALADVFWRRWVREYLPLLQNRREPYGSGTPPKVGDVVVICDPNLPRNTWPKGRVTQVLPGADGEIRVVDVMTRGLVLRRPTKRIVVLPTESPDGDGGRSVHDGIKI